MIRPQVRGKQPERAEVPGIARHEHSSQREDVDEPACRERSRAAEGADVEVTHVEPALHGDLTDRVRLVPRGDLENAGGARLQPEADGLRQAPVGRLGGGTAQRDLAAEQMLRDMPEEQEGVGRRRLCTTAGVARRTGMRSGGARPHLQRCLR
jgi:hypothetical protein